MPVEPVSLLNLPSIAYHLRGGEQQLSVKARCGAMRSSGANTVGRVSVEFEVANYGDLTLADRGLLPADQVRRETIQGIVDSGATKLVLPEAVVKRLGLTPGGGVKVRYADGRQAKARVRRASTFSSSAGMARSPPLLSPNEPRRSWARSCSKISICSSNCAAQKVVPRSQRRDV